MRASMLASGALLLWGAFGAVSEAASTETELNGHRFTLADGLEVEMAAGPPLVERPITIDFDERGRLYVAESSGSNAPVKEQVEERPHRILRLEDVDGDGRYDRRTVFADRMMFPEGTMWFDGSLYVAAPPEIWKLTDTDDDGVADERSVWFDGKTLTGCANDLHGPYLGPDGWIYWCKGAFAEQTYPRPGREPMVTRASHLFRARPDGTGIEPVMTGGMDNPVDIVFTPEGERIFTTTFLVHPGGGQRDGLIHAIYGGVYGKVHEPIFDHPWTGPETMPVLDHLGPAAPSGLARLEGDLAGGRGRATLLACQFNLRKVSRYVLTMRDGSSTFESADDDLMVSDQMDFHPTDVVEDADGSVLVVDTGGWYKLCCPTSQLAKPEVNGAIYRLRRVGAARPADPRGLRLSWAAMATPELVEHLADTRPAVRRRATEALRKVGKDAVPSLAAVLVGSQPGGEKRAAVWTLAGIDGDEAREATRPALSDTDESVVNVAIQSISLRRDGGAKPRLWDLLAKTGSALTKRLAVEAIGRTGDASDVPGLLAEAGRDASRIDRPREHAVRYAMIEIGDPSSTRAGLSAKNDATRLAALVALDQMPGGGLAFDEIAGWMGSRPPEIETVLWIAGRHPEWAAELVPTLASWLAGGQPAGLDDQELARAIGRFAGSDAVQRLLTEVAGSGADAGRRARAAMAAAPVDEAPGTWATPLVAALRDDRTAALGTIRALSWSEAGRSTLTRAILDEAARSERTTAERVELLASTPNGGFSIDPATFDALLAAMSRERPVPTRTGAAEALAKGKLDAGQLGRLADAMVEVGPLEVNRLLPAFEATDDPAIGRRLAEALIRSTALGNVRPDDLRVRLERFGEAARPALDTLLARMAGARAEQDQRIEVLMSGLSAGDVSRGRDVYNGAKASCRSCHAMGYVGGKVGPDLSRIGGIRSERDLLEAIVAPSASFVRSFEPIVVATADGRVLNGLLKSEGPDGLVLVTSATEEVRIPRGDIEEMKPSEVSVMPAGLDQQLTPRELADLVAYLRSLR